VSIENNIHEILSDDLHILRDKVLTPHFIDQQTKDSICNVLVKLVVLSQHAIFNQELFKVLSQDSVVYELFLDLLEMILEFKGFLNDNNFIF